MCDLKKKKKKKSQVHHVFFSRPILSLRTTENYQQKTSKIWTTFGDWGGFRNFKIKSRKGKRNGPNCTLKKDKVSSFNFGDEKMYNNIALSAFLVKNHNT